MGPDAGAICVVVGVGVLSRRDVIGWKTLGIWGIRGKDMTVGSDGGARLMSRLAKTLLSSLPSGGEAYGSRAGVEKTRVGSGAGDAESDAGVDVGVGLGDKSDRAATV